MNYLDLDRKVNIIALVVNDKYCASILENGEIKIVSKTNEKANLSFQEYLDLENLMYEKENDAIDLEYEVLKRKKNVGLSIAQGCLATILFLLSEFILTGVPTMSLFFGGMSLLSFGMIINNINKVVKMQKAKKTLDRQIKHIASRIDNFVSVAERVFSPVSGTLKTKEECVKNIRDSASFVYPLLENYVKEKAQANILQAEVVYPENRFIQDETIYIKLPMTKEDVEVCNDVVKNTANELTYNEMMEKRFPLIEEKEVNKTLVRRFPF